MLRLMATVSRPARGGPLQAAAPAQKGRVHPLLWKHLYRDGTLQPQVQDDITLLGAELSG